MIVVDNITTPAINIMWGTAMLHLSSDNAASCLPCNATVLLTMSLSINIPISSIMPPEMFTQALFTFIKISILTSLEMFCYSKISLAMYFKIFTIIWVSYSCSSCLLSGSSDKSFDMQLCPIPAPSFVRILMCYYIACCPLLFVFKPGACSQRPYVPGFLKLL